MMKKIFGYLINMRVEMLVWELFYGRVGRGLPLGVFLLFLGLGAAGQQLSGVVRDSQTREALAGVSLSSVRTGRVFLTGGDGRFFFAGSLGDTLLVRFLGYKTRRVAVEGVSLPEILLETDPNVLGEVNIYTGYQRIPRERATGSFTLIDEKLFSRQVGTTILDRLPNIAVGVSLDRRTVTPSLSVRGLSTIQGPRSPLIILDNFPYQGSLENLNPNEVESISILKDAAAVSIWGARAGNGVIVITSKRAKFNQGLNFSLTSNLTVGAEPDLFRIKQLSSAELIEVEQMLFAAGKYEVTNAAGAQFPVTPVVALLRSRAAGQVSDTFVAQQLGEWAGQDVRAEFARYFYKPLFNQQYAFTVSGGSEKLAFRGSAGYDRNQNELGAGFNRLNINLFTSFRPLKGLEISSNVFLTSSGSSLGRPGYGEVTMAGGNIPVYTQFADAAGNAVALAKNYSLTYLQTAGNGKLLDWRYYPLNDHNFRSVDTESLDVMGNLNASYRMDWGLGVSLLYRVKTQVSDQQTINGVESFFARDLINSFSQIDPQSGVVTYRVPVGGVIDRRANRQPSQNLRGQLDFSRDFGDHGVAALLGAEFSEDVNSSNQYRSYGYDSEVLTTAPVDYVNRYPNFASGSLGFIPDNSSTVSLVNRFVSSFFNASYSYKKRYTFSVSARKDGSNLFGVLPNNRFNPLGSMGLSWDVSGEPFFKKGVLSYLRLRSTFGYSGNTDQNRTAYPTMFYRGQSSFTMTPHATLSSFANPELKWEKVAMFNAAVDFAIRGDRLKGSVEYYRKNASDLFGSAQVDYTGGAGGTITKNVASMVGSGMDLELQSVNLKGSLGWSTQLNLALNTTRVTAFYSNAVYGNRFVSGTTPSMTGWVGRPLYSVYSYRWEGLDPNTGAPLGLVNGQVSSDYTAITGTGTLLEDLIYHGSAMPRWFGNLGNTFTYRGVSLSMALNYKLGYYFRKQSIDYNSLYNSRAGHSDYSLRWQKAGDELTTQVPSAAYPVVSGRDTFYGGASVNVVRGDHLRLQYVTLNYRLGKKEAAWLPFRALNVYANANNLGLLWTANKDGIDPDYPESSIPLTKNIAIGLRAEF